MWSSRATNLCWCVCPFFFFFSNNLDIWDYKSLDVYWNESQVICVIKKDKYFADLNRPPLKCPQRAAFVLKAQCSSTRNQESVWANAVRSLWVKFMCMHIEMFNLWLSVCVILHFLAAFQEHICLILFFPFCL